MFRRVAFFLAFALLPIAAPAAAQQLPEGQNEAEYRAWLAARPGRVGEILSFEAWQQAAGVRGVLPTWQIVRTASMWRECGGDPFEVPPFRLWPGMVDTLRFVRDHVKGAVGEVEAVSGYRNPALNLCARGSDRSAHLDFFALDLVPRHPLTRRQLFERLCPMHARFGAAAGAGLGFYAFQRFHIDTRSFRRWGAAGPLGNESPCAVLERGEDPEAPPIPPRNGEGDRPQDGGGVPPPVTAPAIAVPAGATTAPPAQAPPPAPRPQSAPQTAPPQPQPVAPQSSITK